MSYFKHLGFDQEPFSSRPDPEFFYRSNGHATALKRLEDTIRQRQGLSLIIGDAGVGKSTLGRALPLLFNGSRDHIFYQMQDQGYRSEYQFLLRLIRMLDIVPSFPSTLDIKDALTQYLHRKVVEQNKTITLVIDDGHKLSRENLEVLRMLVKKGTNGGKYLQLVILAQTELLGRINLIHDFTEHIALKYVLNSLDESEVRQMIEFRLARAGGRDHLVRFSDGAFRLITQMTQGNPREVTLLCREALKVLAVKDNFVVDENVIQDMSPQSVNV